jgi:hypothetical protein
MAKIKKSYTQEFCDSAVKLVTIKDTKYRKLPEILASTGAF